MRRRDFISAAAAALSSPAVMSQVPNAPVLRIGGGSAPGVSGTIAEGQAVTISSDGTNGFGNNGPGSGATVVMFDDCSLYGAAGVGNAIPVNAPVGSYDSTLIQSLVATSGRGGRPYCALFTRITQAERQTAGGGRINRLQFPYHAGEVYWFRAVQCLQMGTFSASFFKTTWALNGNSSGVFDMCCPTFAEGQNNVFFAGDSSMSPYQVPNFGMTTSVDTSGGWNTWESWFSPSPTAGSNDNLQHRSWCASPGKNTDTGVVARQTALSASPRYYTTTTVPGWFGDVNDSRVQGNNQWNMCDLYIAISASQNGGARATVLIGDNATLDSCTTTAICVPTAWSNSSVTVTVHSGAFSSFKGGYLFVINASGAIVPYNGSPGRLIS